MENNVIQKNINDARIAGVVILYNPDPLVIDNIGTYSDQVDMLFVIDNSQKTSDELIKSINQINNTEYLKNESNLGVAAPLNTAAEIALKNGYGYLLTMDQDSKAPENMIDALVDIAKSDEKTGIVSPLHSNRFDTHLRHKKGIDQVNVVMTSGNLLSLKAFQNVGKFCEDFFIDYVDIEYCFRLIQNGYKIYRNNNIVLEHNEAHLSSSKLFGKVYYPHNHKPFRLYYKTRNLLYLRKMYRTIDRSLMKIEYDSYIRTVVKILLFENHKIKKIRMIIIGVIDYLKGVKGRKF